MLNEWRATLEKSFLGKTLDLFAQTAKLMVSPDYQFSLPHLATFDRVRVVASPPDIDEDLDVEVRLLSSPTRTLLELPVIKWLKAFLKTAMSDALRESVAQCELDGIKVLAPRLDTHDKPVRSLIEIMISLARLPNTKNDSLKKFGIAVSTDDFRFASAKSSGMLTEMARVTGITTFEVGQPLLRDGSADISTEEVLAMMSLAVAQNELSGALLYIWCEVEQSSDMVRQHKARQDIMLAVDFADKVGKDALRLIEADSNIFKSCCEMPVQWYASLGQLKQWFTTASAIMRMIRIRLLSAVVADVNTLAVVTEKHTPKYQHFANSTVFARSLVKKHLLQNKNIDPLSTNVCELFAGMSHIGHLVSHLDLPDPRATEHGDAMEFMDLTYNSARVTLEVIAAATILLSVSGAAQRSQAAQFLARPKLSIPKAMLTELQQAAGLSIAGTAIKRSGSFEGDDE